MEFDQNNGRDDKNGASDLSKIFKHLRYENKVPRASSPRLLVRIG